MEIKKNMFFEKPSKAVEISYKADFYLKEITPLLPTPGDLAMMIEKHHYDVASLVMYRSIKQSKAFGKFIEAFDTYSISTTDRLSLQSVEEWHECGHEEQGQKERKDRLTRQ